MIHRMPNKAGRYSNPNGSNRRIQCSTRASAPKGSPKNQRVVKISVVLTQIEPGDSSAAFSLAVSLARWSVSGLACTAAGIVRAGHLGASLLAHGRAPLNVNNTTGQTENSKSSSPRSRIRNKGETRAQRIMANRNGLRHFVLEVVLEDGTLYTLEKLISGVVLYPGSSQRKNHRTVWSVDLDETCAKSEPIFLSDLMDLRLTEDQVTYSFFNKNCKYFVWTGLNKLLSKDTVLEFEGSLWSNTKSNSSYSKFRDTCQAIDRHLMRVT